MKRASWKRHAVVAALAAAPILASGSAATAQPGRPPPPPPPPAAAHKPPPPPPPGAPPPPPVVVGDTQRATQLFQKGSELFKAKKFGPALEQFKASYATVASPNSHLYIARCLSAMGETRAAWLEFDKVSEEAAARAATEEKYAPTRDSANTERDELGNKIGLVTVAVARADANATVRVGTWEVPRERWGRPYPVEPGTYEVKVESPGRPTVKTTVSVLPGDRRAVSLDASAGVPAGPKPVAKSSGMSPLRIGGLVGAGVGVVGLTMFAVSGAMSAGTYSDLKTKCGGDTGGCAGGYNPTDDVSRGKTQQAVANAGLVIGIVGAAAGATLIVLSLRPKKDAAPPSASLTVGPSWAGVKGTF